MSKHGRAKHSVGAVRRRASGAEPVAYDRVGRAAAPSSLSADAQRYSRDARRYSSRRVNQAAAPSHASPATSSAARTIDWNLGKRRKSRAKRIAVAIVAVLLCIALALCAAFLLYMRQLDEAMSLGAEDQTAFGLLGETPSGPYYTLIIGSDTRSEDQYETNANEDIEGERADVIILARIDEQGKQVTLLSIPRDTPWTDGDGQIRKINESYYGGAASVIRAVEDVSGVNVNHYVRVRFSGFENLVDALGGVTVDVPRQVTYNSATTGQEITVEAGRQTLDGEHALVFARARHEYGDNQEQVRQSNIRVLIGAITEKMKQIPITDFPGIAMEAAKCVGTDISSYDVLRLGMSFRGGMTMYGASAPYKGAIDEAVGGVWLCYDDREGWDKVMQAVDSGQDPSTVSYEGDVAYIAGTEETVVIE